MKTAIATLLSVLAVATVSTGAAAEKFRISLNTTTHLSQIDAKIVNDTVAPIHRLVTSNENTRKNDDGNNDNANEAATFGFTPVLANENTRKNNDGNNDNVNEAATFGFTPALAAADTTFSTLSGASIGLAQDQTIGVNTGVTFNKDNSNQNNNDNQPSKGSNIGIVVKSYDGITIQPYKPNWAGSIAVKPDNYPNDIPRIKEPTPAPICQGFAVDNVEAIEGEDEYSRQMVTGCAGTLITNLYFSDGTATRMEDYGTLASAQYKLEDQPWQEFVPSSPFRIPDEGYFMVRTNIVSDVETDDGEAFKLTVRSQTNQVATGMVTMVDPVEAPIAASAEAAMDWSDMGEIIASLDLDDLSPKQALEVLYALQAIENDNRN